MKFGQLIRTTGIALLLAAPIAAAAHDKHTAEPAACAGTGLKCATTATPAFAADGTLWLSWVAGGSVLVAKSQDLGATFSTPVEVFKATDQPLDNGPDARPKIAIAKSGAIAIAFATRDEKYMGRAYVARSADGVAFGKPEPLAPQSPSQRFEAVEFAADGHLVAAWIDKAPAVVAKAAGKPYAGAALAFTADAAAQAPVARIAKDNTCECCRIALALSQSGEAVLAFRNIFDGGVRDHAVMRLGSDGAAGAVLRVSDDGWQTDACPHHGPSLAIGADGAYHVTWFTAGKVRKGVFYARSTDGGATFSAPLALGAPGRQASRPFVLTDGDVVQLAWREFDGESTTVMGMRSMDNGATWSSPVKIAETRDQSDHPLLVSRGGEVMLSWMTRTEGYRLIPLGATP